MSDQKEKNNGSGWGSTALTVGAVAAAFGLGAYLFGSKNESRHSYPMQRSNPVQSSSNYPQPDDCAICHSDFDVKRLPCGHYYHKECINLWKETRNAANLIPDCPKCREPF